MAPPSRLSRASRALCLCLALLCISSASAAASDTTKPLDGAMSSLSSTTSDVSSGVSKLFSRVTSYLSHPPAAVEALPETFTDLSIDPTALTADGDDAFVPYVARLVDPSPTPLVQSPNFCTFPEPFRKKFQRAPRNMRFFRRVRESSVVRFNVLYQATNGVARIRVRAAGRGLVFRRIGVSVRLGGFVLRRARDVSNREWISQTSPRRILYEQTLTLGGVTALRRTARNRRCCQQKLTVNLFVRMCRQVTVRRRGRNVTRLRNCSTKLVQPKASRLRCVRL